jgi:hypothetical protein
MIIKLDYYNKKYIVIDGYVSGTYCYFFNSFFGFFLMSHIDFFPSSNFCETLAHLCCIYIHIYESSTLAKSYGIKVWCYW